MRIVLELCDLGSLRQLLDRGAFRSEDGSLNYPAVLETAADIAKGMAQLHSLNIVHSDLKVSLPGVLPIVRRVVIKAVIAVIIAWRLRE